MQIESCDGECKCRVVVVVREGENGEARVSSDPSPSNQLHVPPSQAPLPPAAARRAVTCPLDGLVLRTRRLMNQSPLTDFDPRREGKRCQPHPRPLLGITNTCGSVFRPFVGGKMPDLGISGLDQQHILALDRSSTGDIDPQRSKSCYKLTCQLSTSAVSHCFAASPLTLDPNKQPLPQSSGAHSIRVVNCFHS